ncbi:MAG: hypothetical protein LBH92_00540 [Bacteroidales bacterium]|jgi:hypothetical protein|nr:hypothetical protein [Bacteroidales bacterium]
MENTIKVSEFKFDEKLLDECKYILADRYANDITYVQAQYWTASIRIAVELQGVYEAESKQLIPDKFLVETNEALKKNCHLKECVVFVLRSIAEDILYLELWDLFEEYENLPSLLDSDDVIQALKNLDIKALDELISISSANGLRKPVGLQHLFKSRFTEIMIDNDFTAMKVLRS